MTIALSQKQEKVWIKRNLVEPIVVNDNNEHIEENKLSPHSTYIMR